ncbi:MAG: hypothetical protein ABIK28_21870 [Planctomycetota bacterium]
MCVLLLFMLFAVNADKGNLSLIAAADLNGWTLSGAAEATFPAIRTGSAADLFDGDPHTFVRCGEKGRAEFFFSFAQPIPFYQLLIHTGGSGVYRWRVEAGSTAKNRLSPWFPWQYIKADDLKPVPVPSPREAMRLKIIIERLSPGEEIVLCDIGCYTTLKIRELLLENCPSEPRVGTPFRPAAVAIDQFSGRLRLDEGVRFDVHPSSMAGVENGVCFPHHAGKAGLCFSFGTLTSSEVILQIAAPDPPPGALTAMPFSTSIAFAFQRGSDASRAFAVCCRSDGDPSEPEPMYVTQNQGCTLFGLQPESIYHLSAAGLDENGDRITPYSEEIRVSTQPKNPSQFCRIASIEVLIVIYIQGFTEEEISHLVRGFEQARLFIFRSSRARLNLVHQYIFLPGFAPVDQDPGMNRIERDLRERRILNREFGAVHVVAENLVQNQSGYLFPNHAVGSQGATAYEPWPANGPRRAHAACWTWVHEFQHSFEQIASRNSAAPDHRLLSGHFLENYPLPPGVRFDAGDAYDGQRETYRRFAGYDSLPEPPVHYLEASDEDKDGLPDDDPRLPFDEKRFLSDAHLCDTDGDGMHDLDEFCAGLYAGTDPCGADTDGDGIGDAEDPYPLSWFTGRIPFGTPRRGEVPKGLLSRGVNFSCMDGTDDLAVHASWDHDFLYLSFETGAALSIDISVDGSGVLGPFESDRAVYSGKDESVLQKPGSDVYTKERVLHVTFGSPHLLCGMEVMEEAHVLSAERNGNRLLWIAIPAALGPGTSQCHIREDAAPARGLTLEGERVLGFCFSAFPASAQNHHDTLKWCSVYETDRFYDAVLLPEN